MIDSQNIDIIRENLKELSGDPERINALEEEIEELEILDLADVDVSNIQDGDTLVYDATSEKFKNAPGGGGGAWTWLTSAYGGTPISIPEGATELKILATNWAKQVASTLKIDMEDITKIISLTSNVVKISLSGGYETEQLNYGGHIEYNTLDKAITLTSYKVAGTDVTSGTQLTIAYR